MSLLEVCMPDLSFLLSRGYAWSQGNSKGMSMSGRDGIPVWDGIPGDVPGSRYTRGGAKLGASIPDGVRYTRGVDVPEGDGYTRRGIPEGTWDLGYPPPPSTGHHNTYGWQAGSMFPTGMLSCAFEVAYHSEDINDYDMFNETTEQNFETIILLFDVEMLTFRHLVDGIMRHGDTV